MAKKDLGVAPQVAGQVRQLLSERGNAVAYGQVSRVAAVDKQLATLGYRPEPEPPVVSETTPPAERQSRQDRAEKTAPVEAGPRPAVQGRRAPGKSTA